MEAISHFSNGVRPLSDLEQTRMHPRYVKLGDQIRSKIIKFQEEFGPLPGLHPPGALNALVHQMVDSQRKIDRIRRAASRMPNVLRARPGDPSFDPEFAAVYHLKAGNIDEAWWPAFLSVHFGRHGADDWHLCALIYGGLGPDPYWTWDRISTHLADFRPWLDAVVVSRNSPFPRFGNHRKYESIQSKVKGLASVLESYVNMVTEFGDHASWLENARERASEGPKAMFRALYDDCSRILRFGRLAKFDFLTLAEKIGLAEIEADALYLSEATGPKRGTKLLFYGNRNALVGNSQLENDAQNLAKALGLGMQAMEDSVCNWQKSPTEIVSFRG